MSKKINKWVMTTIILAVLLLGCLAYVGVRNYKEWRENKNNELRLEGYQTAVIQLMQSGADCQPVNVYIQNETMQFIDYSCLSTK